MQPKVIAAILSGGAGTRLWPVSRKGHPKPYIRIDGQHNLLQKTGMRVSALTQVSNLLTVTNESFLFKSRDDYDEVGLNDKPMQYLLEPCGRNTASAIALAALHANQIDENSILLVFPSDHLITDQAAFEHAVNQAISLAQKGFLVTFGIKPTRPETGFGYIESDGDKVVRFIEKPNEASAKQLITQNNVFWNSGMFCYPVSQLLSELEAHASELLEGAKKCYSRSCGEHESGTTALHLDVPTFEALPDISIDYALMEKSRKVAVVPCEFAWSDIGSWEAVSDLTEPDEFGNRLIGDVELVDVEDCYIRSETRLIAGLGIKNLLIIDTEDALLIADRDKSQGVRKVTESLQSRNHPTHAFHNTVHRPWGTYTLLEESEGYKIKRIVVKPHASLSLQSHLHRSEHWVVVSGQAHVINDDKELDLQVNESTYIPAGHKHRLANHCNEPLILIEVQSGCYVGEDDIERYDDVYGRS